MRGASSLLIIAIIGMTCIGNGMGIAIDATNGNDGNGAGVAVNVNNATIAPSFFRVKFITTIGDIILNITRASAPLGVDRFYELVNAGYFGTNTDNACGFFRVIPGFVVQFGISGDPKVSAAWNTPIKDDPVRLSNTLGTISYATAGANTRTTQLFINYGDNSRLDKQGFAPFGKIDSGLDIALKINSQYGEQPDQDSIYQIGNRYLKANFPKLDYILSAVVVA